MTQTNRLAAPRFRTCACARALALALPLLACGDPPGAGSTSGGSATDSGPTGETDSSTDSSTGGGSDTQTSSAASTGPEVECPEGQINVAPQGFVTTPGDAGAAQLDPCERWHRWYFAAPEGSVVELSVTGLDAAVEARIGYPDVPALGPTADGDTLVDAFTSVGGVATTRTFAPPRSGEFAVEIGGLADPEAAKYELSILCLDGCDLETTRFPMVLVHGWTGFANIGPLDYFYGIPDLLADYGYPVAVTETDKYNASLVRAGELAEQVDALLVEWRARKVDLIGHSQGGVDSRALISTYEYGDRVSALLTIGTPHLGAYVCDVALGYTPGPAQDVLYVLLDFLGAVTDDEKADAEASLHSLSELYMQGEFNPQNPDDPRVEYISYTGRSCAASEFVDPQNDCVDLVDPIWTLTHAVNRAARGPGDGLVTIESAKWGDFRGVLPADHLDEVGQLLGTTDPAYDHLAFFLERARDLAADEH